MHIASHVDNSYRVPKNGSEFKVAAHDSFKIRIGTAVVLIEIQNKFIRADGIVQEVRQSIHIK